MGTFVCRLNGVGGGTARENPLTGFTIAQIEA
jgi:hypothetical protein